MPLLATSEDVSNTFRNVAKYQQNSKGDSQFARQQSIKSGSLDESNRSILLDSDVLD